MSEEQIMSEIKKAIGAHGAWKLKLRTAISLGTSEAKPSDVKCDDLCEFGKWLYGPTIGSDVKVGVPYQVVKRLHAEFHICASKVLELALAGRKQEADALFQVEYDERSQKLIRALMKWRGEVFRASVAA